MTDRMLIGEAAVLPCAGCGDERAFLPPACPDGHGPECPELACVDCGTAVVAGWGVAGWGVGPARPSRRRLSSAA